MQATTLKIEKYNRCSASAYSDDAQYQLKRVQVLGQKCRIHSRIARIINQHRRVEIARQIWYIYYSKCLSLHCTILLIHTASKQLLPLALYLPSKIFEAYHGICHSTLPIHPSWEKSQPTVIETLYFINTQHYHTQKAKNE